MVLASNGGVACSRVPCAGVLYLGESAGLHMPPKIRKASKDSPMSSSSSQTVVNSATAAPLNSKNKRGPFVGPICDDVIVDAVGKKSGHDSVECNGACSTWLHRCCAGLSKSASAAVC